MAFVAALSYGKDSLAMLEVIRREGLPLDRIITAEEWATRELRAVLPEVAAFETVADAAILQRYGLRVEHVRSQATFEDLFFCPRSPRSKLAGTARGWPMQATCWANVYLKTEPMRKAMGTDDTLYLGIAANEGPRILRHLRRQNVQLPLVDAGWTEDDCYRWCEEQGLLSPTYSTFARDGCWFCPNQPVERLRWLRKERPELWALMLRWDEASPVRFKSHGTVGMYEKRFAAEDAGQCPVGRSFRWEMIGERQADRKGRDGPGKERMRYQEGRSMRPV